MVVLFHPEEWMAALAGIPVVGFVLYWFVYRQHSPVPAVRTT
jgi:hypothetical protein